MRRIVCGLVKTQRDGMTTVAGRARDLTISWLRWGYFGDILEENSIDAVLNRAAQQDYDYCLIQGWGHILAEHASPDGGRSCSFFKALADWIADEQFCMAGVADRCMLADLATWRQLGRPSSTGFPLIPFGPKLSSYLIDLKPDLSAGEPFFRFLEEQCEKAKRGVFVLNYESYQDVETTPPGFQSPAATLYSVAAGLKPNRILHTHGFDAGTRVVFFDYSRQALEFRRLLREQWDGWDYPRFLRNIFHRMAGPDTHFHLWPGASAENMDWTEMERLWTAEVLRWGGEQTFANHWSRYRELRHEYVLFNILSEPQPLLNVMEDLPNSVIWWSNAFASVYSATHYTMEQKQQIYEQWIQNLSAKAPHVFLYGADHSNSGVNGMTAGEYWDRYRAQGGDPLLARYFHRRQIRF